MIEQTYYTLEPYWQSRITCAHCQLKYLAIIDEHEPEIHDDECSPALLQCKICNGRTVVYFELDDILDVFCVSLIDSDGDTIEPQDREHAENVKRIIERYGEYPTRISDWWRHT